MVLVLKRDVCIHKYASLEKGLKAVFLYPPPSISISPENNLHTYPTNLIPPKLFFPLLEEVPPSHFSSLTKHLKSKQGPRANLVNTGCFRSRAILQGLTCIKWFMMGWLVEYKGLGTTSGKWLAGKADLPIWPDHLPRIQGERKNTAGILVMRLFSWASVFSNPWSRLGWGCLTKISRFCTGAKEQALGSSRPAYHLISQEGFVLLHIT